MHAPDPMRNWMHHLHDEGVKVAHHTEHMLHAKIFWVSIGILAVIALIIMLGTLFGNPGATVMPYQYYVPMP